MNWILTLFIGGIPSFAMASWVDGIRSENLVTRCVTRFDDDVTFACPRNHVIVRPNVIAGVSNANNCSYEQGDCLGWTDRLNTQRTKCLWQQACKISLKRTLPIRQALDEKTCIGKSANYIAMTSPSCVHKDNIYDMCSRKLRITNTSSGIIKGGYPSCRSSRNRVYFKGTIRLTLQLVNMYFKNRVYLKVRWVTNDNKKRRTTISSKRPNFRKIGKDFKLIWKRNKEQKNTGKHFAVLFRVDKVDFSRNERSRMRLLKRPPREYRINERHQEDYQSITTGLCTPGSIQNRMTWKNKHFTFNCPVGHVVYSPEISVGIGKNMNCKGTTPKLLVQKNECYWRRKCDMSWNSPSVVTMSTDYSCIGKTADVISTAGYKCIDQGKVVDICNDTFTRISMSDGLLRSHSYYPWNYREQTITCRKKIKVGRNKRLSIKLITVDLDEDVDKFTITRKNRTIFQGNTKGFETTVNRGTYEITMSLKRRTKSGKGFMMYFKKTGSGKRTLKKIRRKRRHSKNRRIKKLT